MKSLKIFRHIDCGSLGFLGTFLDQQGIPYELICLRRGLVFPDYLENTSGLIFMGGAGSVNDSEDWILQELDLIKRAEQQGIPTMGICFGAQLISKALGGEVYPAETLEVGWHDIEMNPEALQLAELEALPLHFQAFQWHAHTFSVPADAVPLWKSHCVRQQGFIKGNTLAMQFHLEVTAESIRGMIAEYGSDLDEPSACVQQRKALLAGLEKNVVELHRTAAQFYKVWLNKMGLLSGD